MSRPTPDPLGSDEDVLEQSEMLDEDTMAADPLEAGMDPAEDWSGSDEYGTTATEQATGRTLTDRLDEERPDAQGEPVPERPLAATPLEDLDESVDDMMAEEPASAPGEVLVGEEADQTGESATRRTGYLVAEPDSPAADEIAIPQEE